MHVCSLYVYITNNIYELYSKDKKPTCKNESKLKVLASGKHSSLRRSFNEEERKVLWLKGGIHKKSYEHFTIIILSGLAYLKSDEDFKALNFKLVHT